MPATSFAAVLEMRKFDANEPRDTEGKWTTGYHATRGNEPVKVWFGRTQGEGINIMPDTTHGSLIESVVRNGIFFSDNAEFASNYGPGLGQYKLHIKHTADLDHDSDIRQQWQEHVYDVRDKLTADKKMFFWDRAARMDGLNEVAAVLNGTSKQHMWSVFDDRPASRTTSGSEFTAWLVARGYDSAKFHETLPDSTEVGTTTVVFDPKQIEFVKPVKVAKLHPDSGTRDQVGKKGNPFHDQIGRFASGPGFGGGGEPLGPKLTPYDTPTVLQMRAAARAIKPTYLSNSPADLALRKSVVDTVYGTGAKVKGRRVDFVIGAPGTGKSSAVATPLATQHGSIVIDPDLVKEHLPGFNGGLGAGAVHLESTALTDGPLLRRAMKNHDNIVLPMVGRDEFKVKDLAREFNRAGYTAHLHFVDVPLDTAVHRAMARAEETGRFVDPDYIVNTVGDQPRSTYQSLKTYPRFATATAYNNDVAAGKPPIITETRTNAPLAGSRGTASHGVRFQPPVAGHARGGSAARLAAAIQQRATVTPAGAGRGGGRPHPTRALAKDAGLYVARRLANVNQFTQWVKEQQLSGLSDVPLEGDLHVTVLYSRTAIPWEDAMDTVTATATGWGLLGEDNAVVLLLDAPELAARYAEALDAGATSDYDSYTPHLTLFYAGSGYDSTDYRDGNHPALPPFPLVFGPEISAPLDEETFEKEGTALGRLLTRLRKAFSTSQPRVPGGSPTGGQWVSIGGGHPGTGSFLTQLSTGTSATPQSYNHAVNQLAYAFQRNPGNPAAIANYINGIKGPSVAHSFGQKFVAVKAQALALAQAIQVRPPTPAMPTLPAFSTSQAHKAKWNQGLLNQINGSQSAMNPAQYLAAMQLSKHAHPVVRKYYAAMVAHYGQNQGSALPNPTANPTAVQTPPPSGSASANHVQQVAQAVGGPPPNITPAGFPRPPVFNPTYSGAAQTIFNQRLQQLQQAAMGPNPHRALDAIGTNSPAFDTYKKLLIAHVQTLYNASPAAKAAKAAKAQAAAQLLQVQAQLRANASSSYAAQQITSYTPAKHTGYAGTPTAKLLDLDTASGNSGMSPNIRGAVGKDRGDAALASMLDDQGFSGKPRVVDAGEFDKIVKGGGLELVRTVNGAYLPSGKQATSVDLAKDLQSGSYYAGYGMYGNGTYATCNTDSKASSTAPAAAQLGWGQRANKDAIDDSKAYGSGDHSVVRMVLRPDAKVALLSDLHKAQQVEQARLKKAYHSSGVSLAARASIANEQNFISDPGRFATSQGYDGYLASNFGGYGYFVLLNRSAVAVLNDLENYKYGARI